MEGMNNSGLVNIHDEILQKLRVEGKCKELSVEESKGIRDRIAKTLLVSQREHRKTKGEATAERREKGEMPLS